MMLVWFQQQKYLKKIKDKEENASISTLSLV